MTPPPRTYLDEPVPATTARDWLTVIVLCVAGALLLLGAIAIAY